MRLPCIPSNVKKFPNCAQLSIVNCNKKYIIYDLNVKKNESANFNNSVIVYEISFKRDHHLKRKCF